LIKTILSIFPDGLSSDAEDNRKHKIILLSSPVQLFYRPI